MSGRGASLTVVVVSGARQTGKSTLVRDLLPGKHAFYTLDDLDIRGQDLENLVLTDLLAWRGAFVAHRPEIFYWRTTLGEEVDFVIEWKKKLVGVDVRTTHRPRPADAEHLRTFRDEYGSRVAGCLLLHTGDEVSWVAEGIPAAPWWLVL